jgi:tRNA modification GTPase
MRDFDTIAAIATPPGESGVALIKISGTDAKAIVSEIFKMKSGRVFSDSRPWTMHYGHIVEHDSGKTIDEVVVSYFMAPKSYTAEDVVEITCHGGYSSSRRILDQVLLCGARPAGPGEFTKRAFLNGRIDLSQAEAVIDIINAKTDQSMKTAMAQSQGILSKEINIIREKLLNMLAFIEVTVDFPEDDLESATSEKVKGNVEEIIERIESLLRTAGEGKIIRDGLRTVIAGKPNVGKSSLLNTLLMENRAIVTDVPGTTRDVIEEYLNLDGIPVILVDTAGIRDTQDIVEKIGVDISRQKLSEADLVLFMLDRSRPVDKEDIEILGQLENAKFIVLLNKTDLEDRLEYDHPVLADAIQVSVTNGFGIAELKRRIKDMFFGGEVKATEYSVSNDRHKEALMRAMESLKDALRALNENMQLDVVSIDLNASWSFLGEITGDTLQEDLIDRIFSDFCVGK